MKRLLATSLVVGLLSVVGPPCDAQVLAFGAKLGAAVINARLAGRSGDAFVLPWTGVYLDVGDGVLGMRSEINLVNHGLRLERPLLGNVEFSHTVVHALARYIEVPLLVRLLPLGRQGRLRPYVTAGPTIGRLVDCAERFELYEVRATEPHRVTFPCRSTEGISTGVRFPIASWMLSVEAGGGIQLPLGGWTVLLEARHQRGVTTLQPGSDPALRAVRSTVALGVARVLQ